MNIVLRYLALLLYLLVPLLAAGQHSLSGRVVDTDQVPIMGVHVTYSMPHSSIVQGYSLTDENGRFMLPISSAPDSVMLTLKHMGYEEKQVMLDGKTANLVFTLHSKPLQLSTVVVSSPPVYQRGDTLHYSIDSFTSKEDRVIADVIKKLPGVEMDGDKILYQGKPIQRYYINGLDLLEGRYGLANNNLPVEAVRKVQVIENDQPIKVLDSLVFSDRASLNVQLKKLTTTGTGKVGLGASPALWDVSIAPMTFSKNFQAINVLQGNNVGQEASRQLAQLSGTDPFEALGQTGLSELPYYSLLGIQDLAAPPFKTNRWLDNRTALLSSNMLQKLRNNAELKGSISYLNDRQGKVGRTTRTLFMPDHNIHFSEGIANSYHTDDLSGVFTYLRNERDAYVKNTVQVSRRWLGDQGRLLQRDIGDISQLRKLQDMHLSNRLSLVKTFGSHLATLHSFIGYRETPQQLAVTPGVFEGFLNDSLPYSQAQQALKVTDFAADHAISFVKPLKRLTLVPRVGLLLQRQTLESSLATLLEEQSGQARGALVNSQYLDRLEGYAEARAQFKSAKWKVSLDLPLRLRSYQLKDKGTSGGNTLSALTFEPRGYAVYSIHEYVQVTASSSLSNQFSGINQLYPAYLLTNYRSLQRFDAVMYRSNNWNSRLSLNFKNTYQAVFANLNYAFGLQNRNYLPRNVVNPQGFHSIEVVSVYNERSTQAFAADASKFFEGIKTVVKVGAGMDVSLNDFSLNDQLVTMRNVGRSSFLNLNNNSLERVSLTYEFRTTAAKGDFPDRELQLARFTSHSLEANYFPWENHALSLVSELYHTNLEAQANAFFLDLQYLVKIPKHKLELVLSCHNLWNASTFTRQYYTEFSLVSNYFELRPRQLLATIKFHF